MGTFNKCVCVFFVCNFGFSLLTKIRFSVALRIVFGLLFAYNNAYHNICGTIM